MAYQGALPSPGNVLKVTLGWTEAGALHYGSHFNLSYSGGPVTQADLQAIANAANGPFTSGLKQDFGTDVIFSTITVQDLSTNTGLVAIATPGNAGQATGNTLEAGTAVHLRFKIGAHYRGGHPGIYLPPSVVSNVTEPASWSSGFQTTVSGHFTSLVAGLTGTSVSSISALAHCVVSYYKGPYANPDPSVWAPKNVPKYRPTPMVFPVTAITCTPLIGSQRRRRQATGA
jgi:hypothetical protein